METPLAAGQPEPRARPAPFASAASLLGNGLRLVAPVPTTPGGRGIPGDFRLSGPPARPRGKQFVSTGRETGRRRGQAAVITIRSPSGASATDRPQLRASKPV